MTTSGAMEAAQNPRSALGLLRPLVALGHAALGGRGCLMTFHRAVPSDSWADLPNRDFHLDLGFVDRLLTHLRATGWSVVTVEEATERAARNAPGDRYVNFSVDDCYRDTAEHVVPLFRRHGVPVTLFVTTGIPDGTLPLWGTGLEVILSERRTVRHEGQDVDVSSAEQKRSAYARIAADWDGPQAGPRYAAFCEAHGYDAEQLHARNAISWEMLDRMAGDPLVEVGAHTISHPRVSALSPEEARHEIHGSRARLIERLGLPVRHFAFPYGRSADCGPRDFALARAAGFASASTTRKGLARGGCDPFELPRNTLNGSHRNLALVEAHLAGLTGLAAKVLGRV